MSSPNNSALVCMLIAHLLSFCLDNYDLNESHTSCTATAILPIECSTSRIVLSFCNPLLSHAILTVCIGLMDGDESKGLTHCYFMQYCSPLAFLETGSLLASLSLDTFQTIYRYCRALLSTLVHLQEQTHEWLPCFLNSSLETTALVDYLDYFFDYGLLWPSTRSSFYQADQLIFISSIYALKPHCSFEDFNWLHELSLAWLILDCAQWDILLLSDSSSDCQLVQSVSVSPYPFSKCIQAGLARGKIFLF